jgi:hypothetical protein
MRGVLAEQFPIEVYLSDWHDYHQRHPEPVGGTDIAALATRVIEKAAARPGEPIRAQHVRDIGEAVKSELVLTDAARERLASTWRSAATTTSFTSTTDASSWPGQRSSSWR